MNINVLIDLFFKELPIEERVAAIASCGYRYIETWGGKDPAVLKKISSACADNDISLVSVVMNFDKENDIAPVFEENLERFVERIDFVSEQALEAGCSSGIVTTGHFRQGLERDAHFSNLVRALSRAGDIASAKGFRLNVEPLNTIVDHAGYYLDSREEALKLVKEVGLPNVKMLYDIYHMEIMSGNQTVFITENIESIGHFHCAGVPGRNEPFSGETNYPFIVGKIKETGYNGYFGLEYKPLLESRLSLEKTLNYLARGQQQI